MGKMGKPSGINAGNRIRKNITKHRRAGKGYKKRIYHQIFYRPFAGAPHAKGIATKKIGIEAKQPNSGVRKCVKVQLLKNRKRITAFVPRDGSLNFIDMNDTVLVTGFGKRGRAKGDIPGVKFKILKVSNVSLMGLFRGKRIKPRR